MALTPEQRNQISEFAQTNGYKAMKEHFNKRIESIYKIFDNQTFEDLSKIAALQAELKAIRGVFDFVEQLKGE